MLIEIGSTDLRKQLYTKADRQEPETDRKLIMVHIDILDKYKTKNHRID